jgi:hypothetical protein
MQLVARAWNAAADSVRCAPAEFPTEDFRHDIGRFGARPRIEY